MELTLGRGRLFSRKTTANAEPGVPQLNADALRDLTGRDPNADPGELIGRAVENCRRLGADLLQADLGFRPSFAPHLARLTKAIGDAGDQFDAEFVARFLPTSDELRDLSTMRDRLSESEVGRRAPAAGCTSWCRRSCPVSRRSAAQVRIQKSERASCRPDSLVGSPRSRPGGLPTR